MLKKTMKNWQNPDRVNFQYRPKILFLEISSLGFLGSWRDVDWYLLLYNSLEIPSIKSFLALHSGLSLLSLNLKRAHLAPVGNIGWQVIVKMWMQDRRSFQKWKNSIQRPLGSQWNSHNISLTDVFKALTCEQNAASESFECKPNVETLQ